MNKLNIYCTIKRNENMGTYMAVAGDQILSFSDGDKTTTLTNTVLWGGSGSPYPTPAGGPWKVELINDHPKLGKCFKVLSDKESDIFIHFSKALSYGCFIIPMTDEGKKFFRILLDTFGDFVVVQNEIKDERSEDEKSENEIDYSKIKKWIS